MTAGFQSIADDGVTQIDQDTKNYTLRASGSGACSTSNSSGGRTRYYTQIVVTSATAPLLAIGGNSTRVCLWNVSVSGSTWTFTVVSDSNGAAFNYWVFDIATGTGAYLEIYTTAGELAYAASLKPLRIVGIGGGTYASGRTYAVIMTANGFNYLRDVDIDEDGVANYTARLVAFKVASNVVTEDGFVYESYSAPANDADTFYASQYALVICDVTNL